MKFLSVCSGIEAASMAWTPLGWEAVAFSEIEPFPCSLLTHHYPNTPNWGDMSISVGDIRRIGGCMKPIRLILAMPFYALAFSMMAVSIAVDLIGTAAMLMCAVVGGTE